MLAFGPRAQAWSAVLPADLPIIAVDEYGVHEAYEAAVARRTRAEPFFLWVCIGDQRAAMAVQVSSELAKAQSFDHQRHLMDQVADGSLVVNGDRLDAFTDSVAHRARAAVADLLRLADGLFATSHLEAERIRNAYGVTKSAVAIAALPRPGSPQVPRAGPGRWIAVWAPGVPASHTTLIEHALHEMRLPVYIVADGGTIYANRPIEGNLSIDALLAGASAIVDASTADPADALALAACGTPLVVARSTGAHEYLDGALTYDAWRWKSVHDAVAQAIGAEPPRTRDLAARLDDARRTIATATATPPADGPLVSVIIPTYNRRERLPHALRSIFAQQYRNLEVIVVNDGGTAVDDIVAAFPAARLISYETNGGAEHAINTGYRAACGAYITHVSDDDAFYPDHIARLVHACESHGHAIAHGNTLIRFLRETEGGVELEGFSAFVFKSALEKTEVMFNGPVAGHAFIIRRDVGESLGWYDETLEVLGDQEMQTRYAAAFDFVHVDRVTCEWRYTGAAENLSSRKAMAVPGAMRAWFARHPSDRPIVMKARSVFLEQIDQRQPGHRFNAIIEYPAGTAPFST